MIVKTLDVRCDRCGNWEHGGGAKTAAAARDFVRSKYGWTHAKGADLCRRCSRAP